MQEARDLLTDAGLDFDPEFDIFLGVYDDGRLTAVGARHKNILKMSAVVPEYQDTGVFAELMNALVTDAFRAGYEHIFVFTKPVYAVSFRYLNFTPLCVTDTVAVLEYGRSIDDYLKKWQDKVKDGVNSAIVMNCNPFTQGHRYLAERASAESDNVYLFVVEEDSSVIPFSARFELVRQGTAHLDNVFVIPSGPYAVSRITFPSYFLKDREKVTEAQLNTDLLIFCLHIAKYFKISKRYAGQEPVCMMTRMYNEAMRRILPEHNIEFIEIERKTVDGHIISASSVRDMLINGKYDEIGAMVPETTYKYLMEHRGAIISRTATPVLHS